LQSCHSLPPSSTGNRGMGQRRRRRPIPAAWASGAVRMRGQRGRGCGGPIPGRSSARGGLATAAGGYGRRMALGRRCRARRRLGSGGGALGDSGARFPPLTLDWHGAGRPVHGRQARWWIKLAAAVLELGRRHGSWWWRLRGSEAGQGPHYSRRKAVGWVKHSGGGLVPSGKRRGVP
jgi:hypothetical protein